MDIHKPKPWHNWREFLKELGTIALGVGIALTAEQGVEWWHWRGQVAQARDVIATELANNLVGAIARLRTGSCTERRLDQLAQIVDAAAKKGSLPPLGNIGIPPRGAWPTGAWESVVASDTATHFPRQQLAGIAADYKYVQRLEEFATREIEAWDELATMDGPGRRLDEASESALRKALDDARTFNRIYATVSIQLVNNVKSLNLPFGRDDLDRIAAATHPPSSSPPASICQPIGPPAGYYGQAFYIPTFSHNGARISLDAEGIDQAFKAIPDFSEGAK